MDARQQFGQIIYGFLMSENEFCDLYIIRDQIRILVSALEVLGANGAGAVQAACTICTATSSISGAGRCRGCRHTSTLKCTQINHIHNLLAGILKLPRPASTALRKHSNGL